jgi:hypothetical protein
MITNALDKHVEDMAPAMEKKSLDRADYLTFMAACQLQGKFSSNMNSIVIDTAEQLCVLDDIVDDLLEHAGVLRARDLALHLKPIQIQLMTALEANV